MTETHFYPIGEPGKKWGKDEVREWRSRRRRERGYDVDVVPRIEALSGTYDKIHYGQLDYAGERYDLLALKSRHFDLALPLALIAGGVHGYETSGVLGALEFLERSGADYAGKVNLVAAPCVSPWGYERINRWNYDALDPNRNFFPDSQAGESRALIELIRSFDMPFLMHIDLHETTDTDESEFRPAKSSRDGETFEPGLIPDGFYLVDDSANPQPKFQAAIIEAVEKETHIAPPDANNEIIGSQVVAHGVIQYPLAELGLCASITGARFTTTTEVYPDSPKTTPKECVLAQVTAVRAALDYSLKAPMT